MLFIAFATPLSVKFTFEDFGLSISLPTEPLLILLMGLFVLKLLLEPDYDWRILKSPLSILIILSLFWMLLASLHSSMFVVSIKAFVARTWFVTVFYFMAVAMFRKKTNITAFIWVFSLALCIAIAWTWYKFFTHGMDQDYANYASIPFFINHGVYSATLSFFIPPMLFFFLKPRVFNLKIAQQVIAGIITLILMIAVVLSYARAAWIGLGASMILFFIFYFGVRMRTLLWIGVGLLVLAYNFQSAIYFKLKDNRQVSATNLESHVKSIYNISTDASNTERINRWQSAIRMFKERPILGWGPGTYMFQYAPFQLSSEKTIISTNFGLQGNAHSEYIGPLAEQGLLGMLFFIALLFLSLQQSMNLVYYGKNEFVRFFAMISMLGLLTYFVHTTLNNYLDLDKCAVPFFAFLAIITALKLYHNTEDDELAGNLN